MVFKMIYIMTQLVAAGVGKQGLAEMEEYK
jgi:hypothetical protein